MQGAELDLLTTLGFANYFLLAMKIQLVFARAVEAIKDQALDRRVSPFSVLFNADRKLHDCL